jgi:WD40 repeat protein
MRFLSRRRVLLAVLAVLPLSLMFVAWRAASWRPVIRRVSTSYSIDSLVFSSDGSRVECLSHDGMWNTLSVPSLAVIRHWPLYATIAEPRLAPDGSIVAQFSRTRGGVLSEVLDVVTGQPKKTFVVDNSFTSLVLGEKNKIVFQHTTRNKWQCSVRALNTNRVLYQWSNTFGLTVLPRLPAAFSPDLSLAVLWNSERTLVMHDVHTGRPIWKRMMPFPLDLQQPVPVWTGDGKKILIFCKDGTRLLLQAGTGRIFRRFAPPPHAIYLTAMSPDGATFAEAVDLSVQLRDTASGSVCYRSPMQLLESLAFSPDGSRLAVGTSHGEVQLWRIK